MENSEWASVPKNVSLLWGSAVLTIVTFTSALLLPHTISTFPSTVPCGALDQSMETCRRLSLAALPSDSSTFIHGWEVRTVYSISPTPRLKTSILSLIVQGIEHRQ